MSIDRITLTHLRVPLVTNITNSAELTEVRVKLIAAPLNIRGCDGAPARVLAVLPDSAE
jgi:kynurenine formamidase